MGEAQEGGCACGAVRYRVNGQPVGTSVCHCRNCQRRTGSAFGIGIYFREGDFELLRGSLKAYEFRSDESGRWLRMDALGAPLDGVAAGRRALRAIGLANPRARVDPYLIDQARVRALRLER